MLLLTEEHVQRAVYRCARRICRIGTESSHGQLDTAGADEVPFVYERLRVGVERVAAKSCGYMEGRQ